MTRRLARPVNKRSDSVRFHYTLLDVQYMLSFRLCMAAFSNRHMLFYKK